MNDCLLASFSTETVVGWKMTLHAHLLAHMYMSLEMHWKKLLSIVFTSVKGWADRINAWHSFVAFVLSSSCKQYALLFNLSSDQSPLVGENKNLSYHTTVHCPERAVRKVAPVLISLV